MLTVGVFCILLLSTPSLINIQAQKVLNKTEADEECDICSKKRDTNNTICNWIFDFFEKYVSWEKNHTILGFFALPIGVILGYLCLGCIGKNLHPIL